MIMIQDSMSSIGKGALKQGVTKFHQLVGRERLNLRLANKKQHFLKSSQQQQSSFDALSLLAVQLMKIMVHSFTLPVTFAASLLLHLQQQQSVHSSLSTSSHLSAKSTSTNYSHSLHLQQSLHFLRDSDESLNTSSKRNGKSFSLLNLSPRIHKLTSLNLNIRWNARILQG